MEVRARWGDEPVSRIPFVTSIVLALAAPSAPAAQPRAIVGGHLISALVGWASLQVIGSSDIAAASAAGLSTLAMLATRTLNPPAGLDPFVMVNEQLSADWVAAPIPAGAILLSVFSRLWARLTALLRERSR